jgi:alkanesulfonate monooxygenase SsuD/methylene tetrahydromethanopterin reductase-like flavin-dependent oxidoreductase (luciferase family)
MDDNNNGMKIGLRLPQTDEHRATKENIIRLTKEAENAGFDSLWVLERLIWYRDTFLINICIFNI